MFELKTGDVRELLQAMPNESVQCCVTSPPYWGLRDYGVPGQIGLEKTPEEYVANMVEVFRDVRRVLKDDGTLWLNIGDSYTTGASTAPRSSDPKAVGEVSKGVARIGTPVGMKAKDLVGIPWMVAFALRADGWYLRQDIIWHKPNPMPESVKDRCTKGHEYVFLLTKSAKYYFDSAAIKEPAVTKPSAKSWKERKSLGEVSRHGLDGAAFHNSGGYTRSEFRNKRSVWTVATKSFKEAHFATFPPDLVRPMVLAGSRRGDTVLDPFSGAATTGLVALEEGRNYIGTELNPTYNEIAKKRLEGVVIG